MGKKVTFFFGAGAECSAFKMPSGDNYTLETMLRKREDLYDALKEFYTKERIKGYVNRYYSKFLFEKTSHTFSEIVSRAAENAKEKIGEDKLDKETAAFVKLLEEEKKAEEEKEKNGQEDACIKCIKEKKKKIVEEIYSNIIYDLNECKESSSTKKTENGNNDKSKYESIKDNLEYYGAVEKDFSTIINPNEAGIVKFWRLINYFWSAYFVIVKALCCRMPKYKHLVNNKKEFYKYILENLNKLSCDMWDCRKYDYETANNNEGNYYIKIRDEFKDCTAITTNYTPFVENYFGAERSIYLSGSLWELEYPCEFSVKDIRDNEIGEKDFVFPFLMTQAPVKPIIVPSQIKKFADAICKLEETNVLVIIGYSLS